VGAFRVALKPSKGMYVDIQQLYIDVLFVCSLSIRCFRSCGFA
jgi:hypothetical protein